MCKRKKPQKPIKKELSASSPLLLRRPRPRPVTPTPTRPRRLLSLRRILLLLLRLHNHTHPPTRIRTPLRPRTILPAPPPPTKHITQPNTHPLTPALPRHIIRTRIRASLGHFSTPIAALLTQATERGNAFVGGGVGARAEGDEVAEHGAAAVGDVVVGLEGWGEGVGVVVGVGIGVVVVVGSIGLDGAEVDTAGEMLVGVVADGGLG